MNREGGIYDSMYERFFKGRENRQGYDFQHQTAGSVPPPQVAFSEKLKWWTLDRWKRRKKIRQERDRRLQEIFDIKQLSKR